jgi:hypothetical protein
MGRLSNSYASCMECGGKKMKKGGWIQSAIKKPGSFTKQAKAAGMSVSGFKNKVLANKGDYSTTTVRRANLANTLSKMRKGQEGMEVMEEAPEIMAGMQNAREERMEMHPKGFNPKKAVTKANLRKAISMLHKQAKKK